KLRNSTVFTTEKIAVFASMPSVSALMAAIAKSGVRESVRSEDRKSARKSVIMSAPVLRAASVLPLPVHLGGLPLLRHVRQELFQCGRRIPGAALEIHQQRAR